MLIKRSALTFVVSCSLLTSSPFPLLQAASAASLPSEVTTVDDYIVALEEAAQLESYESRLTQQELESILQAAQGDGQTLVPVVQEVLSYHPDKGLSVYIDTVGLVTPGQSRIIARQVISSAVAQGASIQEIRTAAAFNDSEYLTTPPTKARALLWLGGGLAVAAALGGGGGSDKKTKDTLNPYEEELPARFESDDEYTFTGGYGISKGQVAHQRGFTGKDVVIAVVDTGIYKNHEQFANDQFLSSYDAYHSLEGGTVANDSGAHGTHVAGIIAAQKDDYRGIGYAPDSKLVNIKVTDEDGIFPDFSVADVFPDTALARGYNYAVTSGSQIINNSWGAATATTGNVTAVEFKSTLPQFDVALKEADSANIISVWSTGNSGEDYAQPSLYAALPEFFPELEDTWLAVTSLDPEGSLSSYAQPCGRSEQWCIAAPGDYIISGLPDATNSGERDTYGAYLGTSMAAPAVSGSLALLFEAFPTMSPQQLRQKLLDTADKSGIYADQNKYGNGALDLDAATQPVGNTSLVLPGENIELSSSVFTPGAVLGANNSFSKIDVMVADQYNAGYRINLGSLVNSPSTDYDFDRAVERQRISKSFERLALHNGLALEVVRSDTLIEDNIYQLMVQVTDNEQIFSAGFSHSPEYFPGFVSATDIAYEPIKEVLSNPYVQMGSDNIGSGKNTVAGFSLSQSINETSDIVVGAMNSDDFNATVISFESRPLPAFSWRAQVGQLMESQRFLGSEGQGAFANRKVAKTTLIGLQADVRLSPETVLFSSFYTGLTGVGSINSPLFTQTQNWLSSSYALGGLTNNLFTKGDVFGMLLQQPLALTKAPVTLTLSDGYRGNQFALSETEIDLAPQERQTDYRVFYDASITGLDSARFSLTHIENLNHVAGHDDNVFLVTIDKLF
ncbi:S8 family peptidase [Amphritea balenae]|uniref:Peptidase S8/S53 domain-containing protein n=1 Tax=Amphritea balenae TaxID=452629 RepID=A0A3P1SJ52_9GAMM|nr:S8 family peptidase [Amphritea balenae]RRC97054.1 hypothetical protein EHS89_19030 [Amphritea balenae]GGK67598.1 hypothetical protein GCM10007941_17160 [Amphritea balenae]